MVNNNQPDAAPLEPATCTVCGAPATVFLNTTIGMNGSAPSVFVGRCQAHGRTPATPPSAPASEGDTGTKVDYWVTQRQMAWADYEDTEASHGRQRSAFHAGWNARAEAEAAAQRQHAAEVAEKDAEIRGYIAERVALRRKVELADHDTNMALGTAKHLAAAMGAAQQEAARLREALERFYADSCDCWRAVDQKCHWCEAFAGEKHTDECPWPQGLAALAATPPAAPTAEQERSAYRLAARIERPPLTLPADDCHAMGHDQSPPADADALREDG